MFIKSTACDCRLAILYPSAELYGHLEHSEVDEATKEVGVAWANGLGKTRGTSSNSVTDL